MRWAPYSYCSCNTWCYFFLYRYITERKVIVAFDSLFREEFARCNKVARCLPPREMHQ